jgi:hypothetical protein
MQAFVYRLVERLVDDGPPLSRNRHFHTFDTPEGRQALRIARRLRSVARDLHEATAPDQLEEEERGARRIRLEIPLPAGTRTTWLTEKEWRLLQRMHESPGAGSA